MPQHTKPKSDCIEHTIDINNLKKDMETVRRHEEKFNQTVERVEVSIENLNEAVLKINMNLEHWKDIPAKIRKLEDKSIVYDLIKIGITIMFTLIVKDYYNATMAMKEEKTVKIERIR